MFTPKNLGWAAFSAAIVGLIAAVNLEFNVTSANFWWGVFNGGVFLAVFSVFLKQCRDIRAKTNKTVWSLGFILLWTATFIGVTLLQGVVGKELGLDTHGLTYEQGFFSLFVACLLWLSTMKSLKINELERLQNDSDPKPENPDKK